MAKIRNGFVTNSSSSSFVIVLNNVHNDQVVDTIDKLDAYFIDMYGERGDSINDVLEQGQFRKSAYVKFYMQIEQGRSLLFESISNNDYVSDVERMFNKLGYDLIWEEM